MSTKRYWSRSRRRADLSRGGLSEDTDLRREVESLLAQEHTPLVVDQGMATVAAAVLKACRGSR